MGNKEIDIERLIDSAIAKDRSAIPLLPSEPDPSLVSQLKMKEAISWEDASTLASLKPGLLSNGLIKMLLGILVVSIMAIFSYLLISISKDTSPIKRSETILLPIDSNKEKQNDALQNETRNRKQLVKDLKPNPALVKKAPDLHGDHQGMQSQHLYHSEDLMIPASSKIINKDSVKIPIKRNN
jgi:hypothetical protein